MAETVKTTTTTTMTPIRIEATVCHWMCVFLSARTSWTAYGVWAPKWVCESHLQWECCDDTRSLSSAVASRVYIAAKNNVIFNYYEWFNCIILCILICICIVFGLKFQLDDTHTHSMTRWSANCLPHNRQRNGLAVGTHFQCRCDFNFADTSAASAVDSRRDRSPAQSEPRNAGPEVKMWSERTASKYRRQSI